MNFASQHTAEECTADTEDDTVSLNGLLIITNQGSLREVGNFAEFFKRTDNIDMEIFPLQAELL